MADELYGLTEKDVGVLRELVAAYRRGELGKQQAKAHKALPERDNICFGVASGVVYGTCGVGTPNPETLNVYRFTSTGGTTPVSGRTERIRNMSATDVSTTGYIVAVRDYESGYWITAGSGGSGTSTSKKLCRFLLDAALTTSDASASGKITNQYGDGTAHSTTGTITVGNMLTSATSVYLFSGSSGAAGLAYWDSGTNWRIIQMECP